MLYLKDEKSLFLTAKRCFLSLASLLSIVSPHLKNITSSVSLELGIASAWVPKQAVVVERGLGGEG